MLRPPWLVWVCSGTLAAQTFIVDGQNGPGTAFTSIAAAVAAVPDGAVLDVFPGTYGGFTIAAKGLTLLARPGVVISGPGSTTIVLVSNLGPSQGVTLSGLSVRGTSVASAIGCFANQGPVVLQSCEAVPHPNAPGGGYLVATDCAQMWIVDSVFRPMSSAPITANQSRIRVSRTVCEAPGVVNPGILLNGSDCELSDCTVSGSGTAPATAALALWTGTCRAWLRGATSLVTNQSPTLTGPAIGGAGIVVVDPAVQLSSNGAATTLGIQLTARAMPVVDWVPPSVGGAAHASLLVPANGIGGLFAGFAAAGATVAPFAEWVFVDAGSGVGLGSGTGTVAATFPVPATPQLRGVRIAWQGWSYDPIHGFQASNAIVMAVR
ncbi:MAG: hypothetical protein JNK15_18255 [Planctomycetes bacterium]|nr:hypothetical protein [Planctomycetota bacterium]